MGQNECFEALTNEWQTTKEIAKKLNQKNGIVNHSLKKLYFSYHEILMKDVKIKNSNYIHKFVHAWKLKSNENKNTS